MNHAPMTRPNQPGQLNQQHSPAIFFRSVALFAILYQFRIIADDLADTAVFSATLLFAFAAAAFLAWLKAGGSKNGKKKPGMTVSPLAAIIIIGLIPWIVRAFIALPGLFIAGRDYALTVNFDSLLLNYDRNNFVSLLPFYWAAASTWFSLRSRVFLRGAVIADAVLLTAVFCFTRVSDFAMYRWPIVMIILLAGIIFAQSLALLFSMPPEIKLRRSEKAAAITVLLLLVFIGGFIFLKPSQERAAQKGGGLLEPKLFSFDFSQFLRLDTEISMGDDLILIVKKDPSDDHILMRRSVLSGYNKKQGFYRIEEMDEKTHPQRLPSRPLSLPQPKYESSRQVHQEYFLVNFDANAFVGMREPEEIIPYESWDSSSFKSAYAVESLASDLLFDEVPDVHFWPDMQELGLSEKEFATYTAYGDDERIRALAEEVTEGHDSYLDKAYMIQSWLKYGDFKYSLKPGIAPDGDQLSWFLFESKKGYCSYYAFAMTLMLRSLGIPARVAAGFFINPEDGIFDYYPVRADMAHAWVEVPFPGCGWIEFDPTSENLAEGEEFRFSSGIDPRLLERLMREILENRSRLKVKMGQDSTNPLTDGYLLAHIASELVKKVLTPLLIFFVIILLTIIRCGYLLWSVVCRNKRKKAVCLWKHMRQRLRLVGFGCSGLESEWARRVDAVVKGTYPLYLGVSAARFAPEYQNKDFIAMQNMYRVFSESYRKAIPPWRRFFAWIFPPLAFIRAAANSGKGAKGAKSGAKRAAALLLLICLSVGMDTRAQNTESENGLDADELLHKAVEAEYSEYWERAIDLLKEGGSKYPDDIRFPRTLGRLYYSRSLYSLAWDEYRKAEQINPSDISILLRLANTAGYLNRDRTSVTYLEKVLAIDPDNREAIGSLGWMYYKVHRLGDGERLLVSAIERFGDDADFAMTLAIIYSDMYRYDEGKYWYQKSIALGEMWYSFSAVAHYNLSILESRFYRYDLAMDEANASLDAQNRASGLLARGEINMWRLELEKAQADFHAAREIDSSPLAKLNLAQTYQISGRLEEARLYALDCLKVSDHSWMMHYGIDVIRYKRDIHEILYKTYLGLSRVEQFVPCVTPGEKIRSALRSVSSRFYAAVHRKLYQKYSLAAGDAYDTKFIYGDDGVPPLEQFLQYYNTFETYPRRALFYLNKAQNFETTIIPASKPSYALEQGVLTKNRTLTAQALAEFDPVWECELISQCYRELARPNKARPIRAHSDRTSALRQTAAGELFALNRGALLQAGIGLPLEVNIQNADGKEKALQRALAKAGFIKRDGTRFRLNVAISGNAANGLSASCELVDTEGVEKPLRRVLPLPSLSKTDMSRFAASLSKSVFRVE